MNPIAPVTADAPEAKSADLVDENLAALRALFPQAFTEGRIDFEALRDLLGDALDDGDERYGLNWSGKRQARRLALTPSLGTLRPAKDDSVEWDTTKNLMIEGDNLEVLKLLQKSYAGQVKLIYIDPPYNTGNDFVYTDDYSEGLSSYLYNTGQVDAEGVKTTSRSDRSGRRHSLWLDMIYPRLLIARQLLAGDGVILVSINDIELPRLTLILEEVFGEENHLTTFVWNNEGNVDQQSAIKGVHEYIIAFSKNADIFGKPPVIDPNIDENSKLFNDTIENSITKNGPANPASTVTLPVGFPATFETGKISPRSDKWPHILDEICVAGGKLTQEARVRSGWSSKNLLELFASNGCVPIVDSEGKESWFKLTQTGAIYGYKKRADSQGHVLSVLRNFGTTKQNSGALARIGVNFSYPKPVRLIQYLISVFSSGDDFILDFFAGSGTTGDAVLRQNAQDGGRRRYALVQLPCEARNSSEAISDLTKRRLSHCAGLANEGIDAGFRVYKLAASNLKAWRPGAGTLQSDIENAIDNLTPGRTEDDLMVELLLKQGIDLTEAVVTRDIGGRRVHAFGGGVLVVCLADIATADAQGLADDIATWIEELNPTTATTLFFRDSGFEDNQAKANLAAILSQRLGERLLKVRSL